MSPARIGLTGGIGSGKSAVGQIWRDLGATVLDLDHYARAVLDQPGPGVDCAVEAFGPEYLNPQGTIDRAAMAKLVFSDQQARVQLEQIVHVQMKSSVCDAEQAAARTGQQIVVHESPLLLEKNHDHYYDLIVAVIAPERDRIHRVITTRNKDRAYVRSVMNAQVSDLERIRRAHILILNNSDQGKLQEQAQRGWDAVRARLQ